MPNAARGAAAFFFGVIGTSAAILLVSACSSSSGAGADGTGGQGGASGFAGFGAGSGAPSGAGSTGSGSGANTGSGSTAGVGASSGSGATSGSGSTTGGGGINGSGASPGSGAVSGSSGGALSGGGTSPGGASSTGGIPVDPGPVAVDTTAGRWRTARDATTGRFSFINPDGKAAVLHGISMTGLETGTRETAAGAGFWLYLSGKTPEATNTPPVLQNVIKTLVGDWKTSVVRIPICGSAWAQNYVVHDWGNAQIANYRDWVDVAVKQARQAGAVVIIDNHLWAIAKMGNGTNVDRGTFTSNGATHKYSEMEDGCTGINKVSGTDSCAPQDWYTQDPNTWECAIANADGVTIHNAYKNKQNISAMWADIATRYKGDSGVWFELFNEPYSRKAATPFPSAGVNDEEKDYPWDLWTDYMLTQIQSIRDTAQAPNIVLVNGLDWGYDFGPEYGPIAKPATYLPWKAKYANVAYAFHPYQHGACCGAIGNAGTDASATDPYESGFCSYYKDGTTWGAASGAPLPAPGKSCTNKGYAATQDKKMPPCTWVPTAWNPKTNAAGLCAGDRTICGGLDQAGCQAVDWASPAAGGWSKYALPMTQYGPLIATEFGSFDCSSAFVKTLLKYMNQFGISYTAWALWPQNSGGPDGLGSCGYPAVMTPAADPGDFHQCSDPAACSSLMKPLPWAGAATFADLMSH